MVDRPIIFSGPMVRAIIAGAKKQTRRVIKPQPTVNEAGLLVWCTPRLTAQTDSEGLAMHMRIGVGDRLWVKENWSHTGKGVWTISDARSGLGGGSPIYMADGRLPWAKYWPSIHMPREFSRLTLHVAEVRVQRLQDITAEDAMAEGATARPACSGFSSARDGWSMDWSRVGSPGLDKQPLTERDISLPDPQMAFANFINVLHDGERWNQKPTSVWQQNPWVAAYTFTVEQANINQARAAA